MKTSTMTQIRNCRKNTIGFLHISDIAKIHELTGLMLTAKAFTKFVMVFCLCTLQKLQATKKQAQHLKLLQQKTQTFVLSNSVMMVTATS